MADELSFHFGLSLNSNLCIPAPCLLKGLLYMTEQALLEIGALYSQKKNQVVMELLNQCYQASNGINVDLQNMHLCCMDVFIIITC